LGYFSLDLLRIGVTARARATWGGGVSKRLCFDCGATHLEAAFPAFPGIGRRKSPPRVDRCTDCAVDPGGAGSFARVLARRKEIAALRAAGCWRAQKPIHTTPLFAGLRPGGEGQHMPAHGAEAGGENA
jgi:hypothetical protein